MVEPEAIPKVCPYLRGRLQPNPLLQPDDSNQCILTASIHLPHSQQSRFCLGGGHERCSRYIRQQHRPLPRYVTGVPITPVSADVPVPDLPILVWRRPWFRRLVQILFILLLAVVVAWAWRWRAATMSPRITPWPTVPPTLSLPAIPPTPNPYLPPTQGPTLR